MADGHAGGHRRVREDHRRPPMDPCRRRARQARVAVRHDDRARQPHAQHHRRAPRGDLSARPGRPRGHRTRGQHGLESRPVPSPVPSGSRVRATAELLSVDEKGGGWWEIVDRFTIEIDGAEKPACVAEGVAACSCAPTSHSSPGQGTTAGAHGLPAGRERRGMGAQAPRLLWPADVSARFTAHQVDHARLRTSRITAASGRCPYTVGPRSRRVIGEIPPITVSSAHGPRQPRPRRPSPHGILPSRCA